MEAVIVIRSHRVHPERFAETGQAARRFGQGISGQLRCAGAANVLV